MRDSRIICIHYVTFVIISVAVKKTQTIENRSLSSEFLATSSQNQENAISNIFSLLH